MRASVPLIIEILLLLVVARVAAEIAERSGQPAMIGEVAAGLILGPSLLALIGPSPELHAIADLGVLLLVVMAGMEVEAERLFQAFRGRNIWISVVAFVLPFLLGIAVGAALGLDAMRAIFIGLSIAITALPVSIRILMDLGRLHTDTGQRIITAAMANDILALLILGVILDIDGGAADWTGTVASFARAIAKAILFMGAVVLTSRLVRLASGRSGSHGFVDAITARLRVKEPLFAIVLLFVLTFAAIAEAVGLHFVVGAFFGSVVLSRELLGRENFEQVARTASGLTMGFLAPLFFGSIGLEFNARTLDSVGLVAAILAAAFAGKILAGRVGGWMAGLSARASWTIGIGLNGRGMMELVVANIALTNGFIGQRLFSVLVLMGLVTTLVTPPLLKWAFGKMDQERQGPGSPGRT
jgi:Kef-type K+ transport system membrane component KefB